MDQESGCRAIQPVPSVCVRAKSTSSSESVLLETEPMQQQSSQKKAAAIAAIAYLAAAGCFFALAARVANGSAGYAVAGGLFALAGMLNLIRWQRTPA